MMCSGESVLTRAAVEGIGMPVESVREVELRCPTGPRKLFAKLRMSGILAPVTEDNLIELSCQDCRRRLRGEGDVVKLVLHRFNIAGNLIETEIVRGA